MKGRGWILLGKGQEDWEVEEAAMRRGLGRQSPDIDFSEGVVLAAAMHGYRLQHAHLHQAQQMLGTVPHISQTHLT